MSAARDCALEAYRALAATDTAHRPLRDEDYVDAVIDAYLSAVDVPMFEVES